MRKLLALLAAVSVSQTVIAQEAETGGIIDAIKSGTVGLDMRYRLESVSQDGFADNALASTLRTKLNYRTANYNGFSVFLEFENSTVLGKTTYNNTLNGRGQYPVVADPASTEVNQVFLTYSNDQFLFQGGRQGINLGNQRWVGTVGFRQNDQTYDGVLLKTTPISGLSLTYAYSFNVNRIFSGKHPSGDLDVNAHIFSAEYQVSDWLKISALGLLFDVDEVGASSLSSQTYGVRAEGGKALEQGFKVSYVFEYANQSDYTNNTNDYLATYLLAEGRLEYSGFSLTGGFEQLGSDNGVGLDTPFATLHKFNGWADVFLATPTTGLEDIYVKAGYKIPASAEYLGELGLTLLYHDFSADVGGASYGHEFGWQINYPIDSTFSASVKGAHYRTDGFATDRDKIWFTLGARF